MQRYSYSYSKRSLIPEPTFNHERLDVYRLSIDYVEFSYQITKSPSRQIGKHAINGCGQRNRFFEITRGAALKCAAIHDVLRVFDAIDDESNGRGKCDWKQIVSMLTRLIQRTAGVSEYRRIESSTSTSTSTAMLSTSTTQATNFKPGILTQSVMFW